jgi:hypothetical protein
VARRVKLPNELVETPEDPDAYYKVDVYCEHDSTYTAHIPELGKVTVAKDLPQYPWQSESFAWKIQKGTTS